MATKANDVDGTAEDVKKMIAQFLDDQKECRDIDKLRDIYENWTTYDEDVAMINKHVGPKLTLELLSKSVPHKDARILDCGSGTGVLGLEVARGGYTNIDAMDLSPKSLDRAKEKNIYTNFYCGDAHQELKKIPDNSYDAIICNGCFAPGHFTADIFAEWARVVNPGGFISTTLNEKYLDDVPEHCDGKFEAAIKDLEMKGKWRQEIKMTFKGYTDDCYGIMFCFKPL